MSATSFSPDPGGVVDGRVLRGERNRVALVEALVGLLDRGVARPTAKEIATEAGVSVRTVFQHFDDVESLYAAIVDRQRDRYQALYAPLPARGSLSTRIDALIARRAELFEQIAPVRRATVLAAVGSNVLQQGLAEATGALREQVARLFAPELARAPRRVDLLAAIDLVTSWEAWDTLRRSRAQSVTAAKRVTRLLVIGALSCP